MYVYIYIYIYRERERDVYVYCYVYAHVYNMAQRARAPTYLSAVCVQARACTLIITDCTKLNNNKPQLRKPTQHKLTIISRTPTYK